MKTKVIPTLIGLALTNLAALPPPTSAAPLSVTTTSGKTTIIPLPTAKATVLIYIGYDCPISSSYAPTINKLYAQYGPKGVAFILVYAEPGFSDAQALVHAKQYAYHFPAVYDDWKPLVRLTSATVTPEAAVLTPSGALVYLGRIDNWFAGYGVQRHVATTHDLRDALDLVLANRPVSVPRTRAVGCYISPTQ